MMINELPRDFSSIATTYFEDYDNSSSFAKDMEHNMKVLSGLDPVVTNQEVADYINENNDQELLNGTEDALLQLSDRNAIELATQNMETLGVKKRVNPEISVYDYYTQNEIANKFTDDTYRINFTNTKEDPSLYSTKYMIGSGKVYDALNSLKPNIARLAMRYIGQPATHLGVTALGASIGGFKGAVTGAGVADAAIAGWDASILGGTIYNTQKKYIEEYHRILDNSSLSLEQFTKRLDEFITDINTNVAPEYQHEIYEGIIEGANPFADAGQSFTSVGIKIYAEPFGFLAKAARRMVPFGSAGSNIKRMQINSELKSKIEQSMSNKVDETVVDEEIATKAEIVKPAEATEDEVNIVKGIMKNEKSDQDLLKNSNQDSAMFDMSVSQEDIEAHNTASTVAKMNEEPTTTLYEIIPESRRPKQVTVTRVGKGVNNDPMTWEEAQKWLKTEQGRFNRVFPWNHSENAVINWNPDVEPEYIAVQSASRRRWTKDVNKPGVWDYIGHQSSGAGDEWFLGGGYGSGVDSPWVAAKGYYYKNFSPDIFDFRDYVQESIINDEDILKYAISKYDPNGKYYKRAFRIYDKDRAKALRKWKEDLSSAYALESWMNRQGLSKDEVDTLLEIEKNLFGKSHIEETRRIALENTSRAALKVASIISGDAKGNVDDIIKDAIETLKYEDKELKKDIVKFIDKYKKFVNDELDLLPYKENEEELFEYYRSIVEEQNKDTFFKPQFITDPSTNGETQYSELVELYDDILDKSLDNEGLKNLIQMIDNPENYSPPSAYLQTIGIKNPMKNPEGVLYFDEIRGLVPFSSLFGAVDLRHPRHDELLKKLKNIQKRDLVRVNKVKKDIIDGFLKNIDSAEEDKPFILWEGLPDNPEPWDTFTKNSDRNEALKSFKSYLEINNSFNNLRRFRDLLKDYVKPFSDIKADNYNAWEREYLLKNGLRQNWHNGGDSESFNVAIQNFDDVTPVTLEESGIGTPWWTQIGYNNAHMIESAGDGVGYYGLIVHAPEGSKPVIIKNGKVIDKGDWK